MGFYTAFLIFPAILWGLTRKTRHMSLWLGVGKVCSV